MKNLKIFWKEIIPDNAIEQMEAAMNNDFVVKWVLMPDSHQGYSLLIGWVVATKDVIVPAWVWYDIWCWMCAINTKLRRSDIIWKEKEIFDKIYETIPVSLWKYNKEDQPVLLDVSSITDNMLDIIDKYLLEKAHKALGEHLGSLNESV